MLAQVETKEQAWEVIRQIEEQVRKVILGQDDLIRRILIGLFGRIPYSFRRGQEEKAGSGHILLEGVPGLAKTLLVSAIANYHPRPLSAHPVYAGHAARRHSGNAHLRQQDGRVPHGKGADLRQYRPGGRNQPRAAEDPERAAGGHARAAGDDRREHLPTRRSVLGAGHAKPVEQEGVFSLPEAQLDRFRHDDSRALSVARE